MIFTAILTALLVFASLLVLVFLLFLFFHKLGVRNQAESIRPAAFPKDDSIVHADPQKMKAIIHCDRISPESPEFFSVSGYMDCSTLSKVFQGNLMCRYGCLGLGSCAVACPSDAIILKKGRIFVTEQCTGCGACVQMCPKNLISLVSIESASSWTCPVSGHNEQFAFCATADHGCLIERKNFPETRFKILSTWGIINGKAR